MKTLKRTAAVVLTVAALGLAAVLPAAIAQDSDTASDTQAPAPGAEAATTGPAARHGELKAQFVAVLADELGMDTESVSEALTRTRERIAEQVGAQRRAAIEERLEAAVDEGTLTEEQAAAILDAHDAGVLDRPAFGHPGPRRLQRGW